MTIAQQECINATMDFVKKELADAEGGHDWFHIERVYKTSMLLAKKEKCNPFIVALGALLHDIADAKFHQGDETLGAKKTHAFLTQQQLDNTVINHVVALVENISYRGGHSKTTFTSIELKIVQDADKLDAMGAIGIARCFNYGGFKNRVIYDPDIQPNLNMSAKEYRLQESPTINHFYEKLLLLKDLMHTQTGKEVAAKRHAFMEAYLHQFYSEWDGNA